MASSSSLLEEDQQTCALCLTQFAKYTCPKCNLRFCSLTCYKNDKHLQCSETFYRDNFMTELQQRPVSAADKAKVMEMLKKLEEEDSVTDHGEHSGVSSLEERLEDLSLDKDHEEIWSRLTPSERNEFQLMSSAGTLSQFIPPSTPWWELVSPPLVVSLDSEGKEDVGGVPDLPLVIPDLPSLDTLIKNVSVSPYLCYSVVNILYAYAYTVRLYDMDHHELPLLASQTIIDISSCLSRNDSFDTVESALQAPLSAIQQNRDIFNSRSFSLAVLGDVCCILCSKKSHECHMTRALSDLHRLLGLARSSLKSTKELSGSPQSGNGRQLYLARKKVYFLLVWSAMPENNSLGMKLAEIVAMEHDKELSNGVKDYKEGITNNKDNLRTRENKTVDFTEQKNNTNQSSLIKELN